ncbi:MAG: DUF92 domain-containing protein [Acidobacteriota bacterium]
MTLPDTDHATNEVLRKALHIGFGLGAFALRFLSWEVAAGIAVVAVIANWLLLHRVFGTRVARHERGFDEGIILYPLVVLISIIIFRHVLVDAAIVWVILAFGDGCATLVGRVARVASLPWNREKSWGGLIAFILFGLGATFAVTRFFGSPLTAAIIAAIVLAAIAESLPTGIDDNIVVPLVVIVTLLVFVRPELPPIEAPAINWGWLALNTVLALAGYFARSVDVSGAVAGWLIGDVIIVGAGGAMYLALLAFFVIGTACTKLGYSRKSQRGLAQEKGGRRGVSHAFANVGVAAICAVATWRDLSLLPLFMGIAALATAAADTAASEIGQVWGRRAFLPLTLRAVEPGTEGAISLEGTVAGIVAGFLVAVVGTSATLSHIAPSFAGHVEVDKGRAIATITVCAFLGSYLESVVGSWNRKLERPIPNGTLNFFNTGVGALLFVGATKFVPMFGYVF